VNTDEFRYVSGRCVIQIISLIILQYL